MKGLLGFIVLGFFVLVFMNWLHLEKTYHYRITVPDGRSTMSYYTDGYTQRGNCVIFRQEARTDSSQVCGMYTITRLR